MDAKMAMLKVCTRYNAAFRSKFRHHLGFDWPGWIRTFLWSATLAVLTGLTVTSLVPMVRDYTVSNVATQVEVINTDEPFFMEPDLILCVPYHSMSLSNIELRMGTSEGYNLSEVNGCVECEALRDHSWDVWTDPHVQNDSDFGIAVGLIRKLQKDDPEFTVFAVKDDWYQPLVDSLWLYFACIFEMDRQFPGHIEESERGLCYDRLIPAVGDATNSVIQRLYDIIIQYTETYMKITTDPAPKLRLRDLVIPLLDPHQFCFYMPQNNRTLQPSNVYRLDVLYYGGTIYQALAPWYHLSRDVNYAIYSALYSLDSFAKFSFNQHPSVSIFATRLANLTSVGSQSATLKYSVDTAVMETREDKNCVRGTSFVDCEGRAKLDAVISVCGCFPFAYRYLINSTIDLPFCDVAKYNACREHWKENTTERIKEKCSDKCEHVFYGWDKVTSWDNPDTNPRFTLDFSRKVAPLVRFSITAKSSRGDFLAAVGGIVNLYLGFSGFTICALILIMIDMGKHWWRKRNNESSRTTVSDALSGWRQFWLTSVLPLGAKNVSSDAADKSNEKDDAGAADKSNDKDDDREDRLVDKVDALEDKVRAMEKVLAKLGRMKNEKGDMVSVKL